MSRGKSETTLLDLFIRTVKNPNNVVLAYRDATVDIRLSRNLTVFNATIECHFPFSTVEVGSTNDASDLLIASVTNVLNKQATVTSGSVSYTHEGNYVMFEFKDYTIDLAAPNVGNPENSDVSSLDDMNEAIASLRKDIAELRCSSADMVESVSNVRLAVADAAKKAQRAYDTVKVSLNHGPYGKFGQADQTCNKRDSESNETQPTETLSAYGFSKRLQPGTRLVPRLNRGVEVDKRAVIYDAFDDNETFRVVNDQGFSFIMNRAEISEVYKSPWYRVRLNDSPGVKIYEQRISEEQADQTCNKRDSQSNEALRKDDSQVPEGDEL